MAIQGINGIFLGGNSNQFIDLDIVNGRVLSILRSGSLGVASSALVENPAQLGGATVIYRKPEMLKTGAYGGTALDDGTGGISQQAPDVGTVLVNIDKKVAAKYKLEDFDLVGLNDVSSIIGQIANGLAISTLARQDLELFENIKKFIMANEDTHSVIMAGFDTTYNVEEIRTNRLKLNDLISDIETTITSGMVGTEEFQTTTLTTKKAYARMLEGISQAGGNLGTELRLNGQLPSSQVGGNAVIKNIFMAKNVDATIFTLDKTATTDFDFSKILALMWNKEAIAFPIQMLGMKTATDIRDGNDIFIMRFRYGFEVLRPELIRAILSEALTPARKLKIEQEAKQEAELKTKAETDLMAEAIEQALLKQQETFQAVIIKLEQGFNTKQKETDKIIEDLKNQNKEETKKTNKQT